jgi:hypothetical protein
LKHRVHSKAQSVSNAVVVSTPDLLKLVKGAIYIPNPIDTEHFRPNNATIRHPLKEGLTIDTEVTDIRSALEFCRKNNISLDIEVYDRIKQPVTYKDMPKFLNQYRIYLDIRYVNGIPLANLNKTALEALACGLEVLDYKLHYHKKLPSDHQPIDVASRMESVYEKA